MGRGFHDDTTEQGESIEVIGKLKMAGHPVMDAIYEHWLLQKEYHAQLRGPQIKEYYSVLRPQISYPDIHTTKSNTGIISCLMKEMSMPGH
jgi:hypothetical protein